MHEHSVCRALITQAERIALEHQAKQIKTITVKIGPLAGIVIDELREAFPHNSEGTIAEGAHLMIQEQPLRVSCQHCQQEADASLTNLSCPHCHSQETTLISGDTMEIVDLELGC